MIMKRTRALIIFIWLLIAGFSISFLPAQGSQLFTVRQIDTGVEIGLHDEVTDTDYVILGSGEYPAPVVLARSDEGLMAIESAHVPALEFGNAGTSWKMGGLTWTKGVFKVSPGTFTLVCRAYNPRAEVLSVETDLVFDLPDTEPRISVFLEENEINHELSIEAKDLSGFHLSSGTEARLRLLPISEPSANQDTWFLANTRRLLSIDGAYTFEYGRNFSVLPISIQDRSLGVRFKPVSIKPRGFAYFMVTMAIGTTDPVDASVVNIDLQKELARLQSIQQSLNRLDQVKQDELDALNALIEKITQILQDGNSSLEDRERLFQALEQARGNVKHEAEQ